MENIKDDEMYILHIKADPNDADYIYNDEEISGAELKQIIPVVKQLLKTKKELPVGVWHNAHQFFDYEDYQGWVKEVVEACPNLTEEQVILFYDMVPTDNYSGEHPHTIHEVSYYPVPSKTTLFDYTKG